MEEYKGVLQPYAEEAFRVYQHFHQNPELSFEEVKTAEYLLEQLTTYGVEFQGGYSGTSIACYVNGEQDGPTIAFRADIDALPIQEETGLPYTSKVPGVMHACGHDVHAATLLMLAKYFSEHRDQIRGRIKFLFQQGEELLPGGAKGFCEEGVLDDVDEIYAWHVSALYPIGEVGLVKGAATAAVGAYRLRIVGKGGHGGFPHLSNNPIFCGSAVASAIGQLGTTRVPHDQSCAVTVGYFLSGTDQIPNVIPGEAVLGGNLRSLNNETQKMLYDQVRRICHSTCEAYGCDADLAIEEGYPATLNAEHPYGVISRSLDEMGLKNLHGQPQMGAEDFAYYTLEKPAGYVTVGMKGTPEGEAPTPHHNSHFCIDAEHGIPTALEMMIRVYQNAVSEA